MSQQTWTYKLHTACTLSQVQADSHLPLYPSLHLILLLVLISLSGCCSKNSQDNYPVHYSVVDTFEQSSPMRPPSFTMSSGNRAYNVIGTPQIEEHNNHPVARVSGDSATLYVDEQQFTTGKSTYTNKIYRIHFPEVPFGVCNLNITAGKNPGLLVIYTIDTKGQIILITTVHSCGCYLAFIPTTALNQDCFPKNWPQPTQSVYGYRLPSIVPFLPNNSGSYTFTLAGGTHRVMGVTASSLTTPVADHHRKLNVEPMVVLNHLPYQDSTLSFFETDGPRKGYVKNNTKILERLLISWWAFDWYVGEDKAYGTSAPKEPPFYTSLKFWQRSASDMKDFPKFLSYWGWHL